MNKPEKKVKPKLKTTTTISVKPEIRDELFSLGDMGLGWDKLFEKVITFIKKREKEWKEWKTQKTQTKINSQIGQKTKINSLKK